MTKPRIDYPALFPHVIEGYIQGKSQMAIAADQNTHPTHVSRALHVHGLSHWKLLKLIRDGITAQQIIEYATAKEPRLPLVQPEPQDEVLAAAHRKIQDQSQVIRRQAHTIETMQRCFSVIHTSLKAMQEELDERQKAGAA